MFYTILGPDIPYACICHTASSHNIVTFETNPRLESSLKTLDMPILRFLEIPVSESDQKAQVKLMLPPDFDSGKTYPLVVYAYGGPGYQTVNQKFDWNEIGTFLAGSADVIYAIVDPRGSGYQGEDWRFAVYKRFGTAEVQSLTQVAKHLQVQFIKTISNIIFNNVWITADGANSKGKSFLKPFEKNFKLQ